MKLLKWPNSGERLGNTKISLKNKCDKRLLIEYARYYLSTNGAMNCIWLEIFTGEEERYQSAFEHHAKLHGLLLPVQTHRIQP